MTDESDAGGPPGCRECDDPGRPAGTNVTSDEVRHGDVVVSAEELGQSSPSTFVGVVCGGVAGHLVPARSRRQLRVAGEFLIAHLVAGAEEPLHVGVVDLLVDQVVGRPVGVDGRQNVPAEVVDGLGGHRDRHGTFGLGVEPHEEVVVARADTDGGTAGDPDHGARAHASLVDVLAVEPREHSTEDEPDDELRRRDRDSSLLTGRTASIPRKNHG